MKGQYAVIGRLIGRKKGATVAEIVAATCSSSPHRRFYEMRCKGWRIWRVGIEGKNYGRYYGQAPKGV